MKIYGAKAPWPFLKGLIRDNRPVWFFEETGLPYERISLDPTKGETKSPEYTRLNRFQKIPTYVSGELTITQSAAILLHLAETTGQLYPKEEKDRIRHLEWMFFCVSDVEAHAAQMVSLLPLTEEKDRPHAQWMLKRAESILARALNYLNGELEGHTFLLGEEFLAADILLGCSLFPIRDHELTQSRHNIKRLIYSYYSRPAFKRMLELNGT
jgi:glutathione S-transferase